MDYIVLKNEIVNDPKQLGLVFSETPDSDKANSDLLNDDTQGDETENNKELSKLELLKAITESDLNTLSIKQISILQLYLLLNPIDISNNNIFDVFKSLFIAGSTTRANLTALVQKRISRAQKLFGQNVSSSDVHKAKRLP